jgi:cephalosporin-C deacetylase
MPLTFDMPLSQLKTYNGRNPRPSDFDSFWDTALGELKKLNAGVVLEPAPFAASFAECFDLYFTGTGGSRVHAKFLRPRNCSGKVPAVLMFHGYSGNSGAWIDKLPWVARGFAVAALDCRGQGGLSEDRGGAVGNTLNGHIIRGLDDTPEKMMYHRLFLDTAQLASIVMNMPDIDPARVAAMGGSQGGGLTLACAALEPRIKLAVPVFPFLSDYLRVWEMDLAKDAYNELKEYFRRFDPLHRREMEVFTKLGYVDVQHLCPRITAEVLMFTGLMDTICPPSTQFAAYNKIRSHKTMELYPDFGHEDLPGHQDTIWKFFDKL